MDKHITKVVFRKFLFPELNYPEYTSSPSRIMSYQHIGQHGEADTWFSIPAVCKIGGKRVKGYVTKNEQNIVFRHVYY